MKTAVFLLSILLPIVHGVLETPTECGVTLGCYRQCSSGSCDFVVTWADDGAGNIEFTVSRTLADPLVLQWVAVGFSTDTKMGDDSVLECVMESTSSVQTYASYNFPEKYNDRLSDPKAGIVSGSGSVQDGVLQCTILRTKTVSGVSQAFDLNNDYYVLVAHGLVSGSGSSASKSQHSLSDLPRVSPSPADFQSTSDLSGSLTFVLVKVHGCLMVFAWLFCASIGIVFARFFKPVWPASTLLGEKVWFTFHRALMVLTFLACAAAFIIIFVYVQGWSELIGSSTWQQAHPYIGTIVTGLVILNPLMALCRPHPEDKNRPIFNYFHWAVGFVAHGLSMLAMIIGVTLGKASVPFYVVWILVAFVCYQVFMIFVLELTHFCGRSSERKYKQMGQTKTLQNHQVKKALLGIHVLVITGFTVAVIVLIAIN